MANRLSLYLGLLTLSALLLCVGEASAFGLASGYPQRTNTDRSAPPPGLIDLSASDAGLNRADCLDDKQRFSFSFTDAPSDATSIEVWARADAGSCAPPAERTSNCFRVARWESGVTQEIDNLSIIQAMEQKKSVDTKADAKELCGKTTHMTPTAVHLHVMAFHGSDVVGYSTGADSKPAEIDYVTLYDIGGPNAPVGFTLGTGESLLTVKLPAISDPAGDFQKYRVYCFRGSNATDAGADAAADGASDAATDAASDAATEAASDAGAVASASNCPTGHPFVPGTFPTRNLEPYMCAEPTSVSGEIMLDGRGNNLPYAVAIAAVDKQGNTGILSPVVCETPRATNSFWDNYEAAGGRAGGGCSFGRAPAGSLAILVLAALAFAARRKRITSLLVALPLLFLATPSRADEEAPSWLTMEARFGPYRPKVDDAFPNGAPYEKTFGASPRLMGGVEADFTPLHVPRLGSLGIGGLIAYTHASAHQVYAAKGGPSDSKTSFDLWLLGLVTSLRIDVFAREMQVPIVPYVKLGLMTGLWSSSDDGSISRSRGGREARGHTNGLFHAVGVMFLLDALDPQAAKTFSVERGVKHSYVFGELTDANLGGFGQREVMRVGALTWTVGIAFEM